MANHIFFPNFCPQIPNSQDQKKCFQTKYYRKEYCFMNEKISEI